MRLLLLLLLAASASAATSDAERLARGLPAGFRRPTVRILPLLDHRALAVPGGESASVPEAPPPPAWAAFVEALSERANLDVSRPAQTLAAVRGTGEYQRTIRLAEEALNRGYADYREVKLDAAVAGLRGAVETFVSLGFDFVDRRAVARARLTIGLALLEGGDTVGAHAAIREALLTDPSIRLRAGFDRPDAVEALSAIRAALLRAETPPPGFTTPESGESAVVIHARAVGDRLEVAIHRGGAVSVEAQPLGSSPEADGERLASRVWACLPFGSAPAAPGHRSELLLDAGFAWHLFTLAPVTFSNFGLALNASWLVQPNLALDFNAGLSTSGRDTEEDLREDLLSGRLFVGPGYSASGRRLRGGVSVGVEAAFTSAVVLTSHATCKYFDPEDGPPAELCDYDRHLDRGSPGLLLGPALVLSGGVRLIDEVYLSLRLQVAHYFYDPEGTDLGLPVGAQIGLGYLIR